MGTAAAASTMVVYDMQVHDGTYRWCDAITLEYLTKGRTVLVEGTLKADPITGSPRIFERTDGTVGASFELRASQVKFVGGDNTNGDLQHVTVEQDSLLGDEGDEIPF